MLIVALAVFGLSALLSAGAPAKDSRANKAPVRTDVLGEPLPPQAVARLGSLRFFHNGTVRRVILSTDGKWVVSSATDGNRMWEAASGHEVPLREELRTAAVFATRDRLVGVAKQQPDLQLRDMVSGEKIGAPLPAAKVGPLPLELHFGGVSFHGAGPLALAPDGRTLVICNLGKPSVLHFFDVARGHAEEPIPLNQDEGVQTQMAFSADSKTLALQRVGRGYAKIHVWDVERRREIIASPSNIRDFSGEIVLSPDGKMMATADFARRQVRLWDTRTFKELPPLEKQTDHYVGSLAFAPDGKHLATSNDGSLVRVWDLASRKQVRQLQGKDTEIYHLIYSADGKYLAAGDGSFVTIWEAATGKPRHESWHTDPISSVAFSPDGRRLVSGAAHNDPIARIWDPLTGKETAQLRGHTEGILVVAYSADGKWIASGGQDQTIRLWDAATGREVRRIPTQDGYVLAMAFAPDGKTIASGGWKRAVHFWDTATGREVRSFANPGNATYRLAYSPDGKWIATTRGWEENVIRVWDVAKGKQVHALAAPPTRPPSLAFSADSTMLAAGGADGNVYLWDTLSGQALPPLAVPRGGERGGPVESLAFSPDGRLLAVGCAMYSGYEEGDCLFQVWELASRRPRLHYKRIRFISHRRSVESLAFSPDSRLLATGSDDRTILIWDLTGQRTLDSPRQAPLSMEQRNALWRDLAEVEARRAYRAMQMLAVAGEQTVSLFKQRLRPAAIEEGRIEQLLANLDNDQFAVREKAANELRRLGEEAEPMMRKSLTGKPSVEQRLRVKQLLEAIETAHSSERLRGLRAVEVLEWLGNAETRRVLRTLADGDPHARLTREAGASLERLVKRGRK